MYSLFFLLFSFAILLVEGYIGIWALYGEGEEGRRGGGVDKIFDGIKGSS